MNSEKQLSQTFKDIEPTIFVVSTLVMLLSFCFLIVANPTQIRNLMVEDGVVENLGAIAYFAASLGFFWLSLKNRRRSRKWIWYALLGLLFFLCAGEEISWGQRLIGLETPAALKAHNAQGEFNLHNLWIFHYSYQDGSAKTGLATLLVPARLLTLFFITYTLVLPVVCQFFPRASFLCKSLSLPVPGWRPGVFFAMMLVADAVAKQAGASSVPRVNELKEMYCGVCAVLLLINLTIKVRTI